MRQNTNYSHMYNFVTAKMVAEEHFGGFLTKKQEEGGQEGKQKTWKERMEEVIVKSKKEKV